MAAKKRRNAGFSMKPRLSAVLSEQGVLFIPTGGNHFDQGIGMHALRRSHRHMDKQCCATRSVDLAALPGPQIAGGNSSIAQRHEWVQAAIAFISQHHGALYFSKNT